MNQKFLLFVFFLFTASFLVAQTKVVVADWETTETSYFGNSWGNGALGNAPNTATANPDASGANTSANVSTWTKANDAKVWAGFGFTPSETIDFTGDVGRIYLKVYADHEINVKVILEKVSGDNPIELVVPYTKPGKWRELTFDFGPNGQVYEKVSIFLEIGVTPSDNAQYYIDDFAKITGNWGGDITMFSDNESGDTTHVFAFGNGHFEDSTFAVVTNPTSDGVNSSGHVRSWCEGNDGKGYAGFGYKIETIDLTGSVGSICISVLVDHKASFRIKSTGSSTGGPQVRIEKQYTTPGAWQQLCFDFANDPDINSKVGLAMGNLYSRFDIYMDYNVDIDEDDCFHFDNIFIVEDGIGLFVDSDQHMISDNEPGDNTPWKAFGNGHFADSTFTKVANPNTNGIDTSATVHAWCKANDAAAWSSFYLDIDSIDCTGDKAEICINVLADHAAPFNIKIKKSETGPDVVILKEYTKPGEWQQICFDFANDTDSKGNVGLAMGAIYTQMVFYFDYGVNQTNDDCYFFDNMLINEDGEGILPALVENKINENAELSDFKAYVTATDLWATVNSAEVTVFAPTNSAFAALSSEDKAALDDNTDNATYNMVLHHIVPKVMAADALTDGLVFTTLNGQDGTVSGTSINGAAINSSVDATNGVLHALEGVMAFPNWPEKYLYSDFDGAGSEDDSKWFAFDWGYLAGVTVLEVADNPLKEGINTSDKAMKYKRVPAGKWWQGIASPQTRAYNFYGPMQKVCLDIYAPDGNHELFFKYTKSPTPNAKSGFLAHYEGGEWKSVCMEATEKDWYDETRTMENNIFPGTALLFDTEAKALPTDTIIFYVDNWRVENVMVGTNNISKLENFDVAPNPTHDFLTVRSSTPIAMARVYDITGRILLSTEDPVHNILDVSALKGGVYFIRFNGYNGEDQGTVRFVKQ